ncbi:MAG: universal stress protein [Halolamina sp.]|uniref:universal stress protein n=1 Tax=Halolamina sp. TaxID=1940283 RepID=UPI002FC35F51
MNILVAVDGSKTSENALAHAIEIAEGMSGSITVVNAVDPTVGQVSGNKAISSLTDADERLILEGVEDAEQRGMDILDDAAEHARVLGFEVEQTLLYGPPAETIADFAESDGFDAIFAGHRGRSEKVERFLGSVAKKLVERSTVPVTVVR